jgi:hypothetical protein
MSSYRSFMQNAVVERGQGSEFRLHLGWHPRPDQIGSGVRIPVAIFHIDLKKRPEKVEIEFQLIESSVIYVDSVVFSLMAGEHEFFVRPLRDFPVAEILKDSDPRIQEATGLVADVRLYWRDPGTMVTRTTTRFNVLTREILGK